MLLDDYSGPFEPGFDLARLSRRGLAVLGREWLLHGHLQDRVGMPLILARTSRVEMEQLAIDEWMSASPIYSLRMQRALGFTGSDVSTILKNLQLDIGAPHQFMDFRFSLRDAGHGEFWLAHCGALMDVEPLGEEFVVGMCHHIEDPTFDATAGATNRRAQVRPLHRPPRVPADQHPHCHWTVDINPAADPVADHPNLTRMEASAIARIALPGPGMDDGPGAAGESDGWADYSGAFDPDFELEDLSQPALVVALQEFAVQSHLLFRAYLLCVTQRYGAGEAAAIGPKVFTGLAGVTAERLCRAMQLDDDDDATTMAKLLQVHPVFHPRAYVDLRVDVVDDSRIRFAIRPCPALAEEEPFTWLACLEATGVAPLDAIVRAVNPRARCRPVEAEAGEWRAYEAFIDPAASPAPEPAEMSLVKISTGAAFQFRTPGGRPGRPA